MAGRIAGGRRRYSPNSSLISFLGTAVCLILLICAGLANLGWEYTASGQEDRTREVITAEAAGTAERRFLWDLHLRGGRGELIRSIEEGSLVADALGNVYGPPYFDLCAYDRDEDCTELVTGGRYRYLAGTCFSRPNQPAEAAVSLRIYADGELVYDSGEITPGTAPVHFRADIGYAQVVQVMSVSGCSRRGESPGVILVDAVVHNEEHSFATARPG